MWLWRKVSLLHYTEQRVTDRRRFAWKINRVCFITVPNIRRHTFFYLAYHHDVRPRHTLIYCIFFIYAYVISVHLLNWIAKEHKHRLLITNYLKLKMKLKRLVFFCLFTNLRNERNLCMGKVRESLRQWEVDCFIISNWNEPVKQWMILAHRKVLL